MKSENMRNTFSSCFHLLIPYYSLFIPYLPATTFLVLNFYKNIFICKKNNFIRIFKETILKVLVPLQD